MIRIDPVFIVASLNSAIRRSIASQAFACAGVANRIATALTAAPSFAFDAEWNLASSKPESASARSASGRSASRLRIVASRTPCERCVQSGAGASESRTSTAGASGRRTSVRGTRYSDGRSISRVVRGGSESTASRPSGPRAARTASRKSRPFP